MRIIISKGGYEWISKDCMGEEVDIFFDKQKLFEENGYILRAMTPEENETFTKESEEQNDIWKNETDEEAAARYERSKEERQKEEEGKTEEELQRESDEYDKKSEGYFEFIYTVEILLGYDPIMPYFMWIKLTEEEQKKHLNR